MYKALLNKISSFFYTDKSSKDQCKTFSKKSYMDVIFSLNEDFDIDVNVYLNDNDYNNLSTEYYGLLCAEFLNIIKSGKLNSTIIDILDKQISNNDNKILVQQIFYFLDTMNNKKHLTTSYIKPSQVFSKYAI